MVQQRPVLVQIETTRIAASFLCSRVERAMPYTRVTMKIRRQKRFARLQESRVSGSRCHGSGARRGSDSDKSVADRGNVETLADPLTRSGFGELNRPGIVADSGASQQLSTPNSEPRSVAFGNSKRNSRSAVGLRS